MNLADVLAGEDASSFSVFSQSDLPNVLFKRSENECQFPMEESGDPEKQKLVPDEAAGKAMEEVAAVKGFWPSWGSVLRTADKAAGVALGVGLVIWQLVEAGMAIVDACSSTNPAVRKMCLVSAAQTAWGLLAGFGCFAMAQTAVNVGLAATFPPAVPFFANTIGQAIIGIPAMPLAMVCTAIANTVVSAAIEAFEETAELAESAMKDIRCGTVFAAFVGILKLGFLAQIAEWFFVKDLWKDTLKLIKDGLEWIEGEYELLKFEHESPVSQVSVAVHPLLAFWMTDSGFD